MVIDERKGEVIYISTKEREAFCSYFEKVDGGGMKCNATAHTSCLQCKFCKPLLQERVHVLEEQYFKDLKKINEQKDTINVQKKTINDLKTAYYTEVKKGNELKEELEKLKGESNG